MSAPQLRPRLRQRQQQMPTANLLGRPLTFNGSTPILEQLKSVLGSPHVLVRISDMFTAWDTDQSGSIDKVEFRRALHGLGVRLPRPHLDELFDEFDTDRSGTVMYKELRKQLRAAYNIQHMGREQKKDALQAEPDVGALRKVESLKSMIIKEFGRIEQVLTGWIASDALASTTGFHVAKLPPPEPEAVDAAKEAITTAKEALAEAVQLAGPPKEAFQAAVAAITENLAKKKPKKGQDPEPDPELDEARDACDETLQQALRAVSERRDAVKSAIARVKDVRAENEMRQNAENLVAYEASLQDRHAAVTGRPLPCRLPFVVRQASAFVRERAAEVHLSFNELRRVLGMLWQNAAGEAIHDKRTVGILFAALSGALALNQLTRKTKLDARGVISLATLHQGCAEDVQDRSARPAGHTVAPFQAQHTMPSTRPATSHATRPASDQAPPLALRPTSAL